jgi:hypothetical protein
VSISRREVLQQWTNARRAMMDQDLPPHVRALAKKVRDHAEVVLEMQDAEKRKAEREEKARD